MSRQSKVAQIMQRRVVAICAEIDAAKVEMSTSARKVEVLEDRLAEFTALLAEAAEDTGATTV